MIRVRRKQRPGDYPHVAGCWPFGGGRATTCKYDAQRNIIMSGVLNCIVQTTVYTIRPHLCTGTHTLRVHKCQEKSKISCGSVKTSLNSQYPVRRVRCGWYWVSKGRQSSVSSQQGSSCRSGGARRAKGRSMEISRHRKLSLRKSEPAAGLRSPPSTTRSTQVNVKYNTTSALLSK